MAVAATLVASTLLAGCKSDTPASLLADAKQLQQKGDRKAAQIQLKNVLVKDPDNGEARLLLARLSLSMNDAASAEKEARRALALKYQQPEAEALVLEALLRQGEYAKLLEEADNFGQRPAVQVLRGEALIGLQRLDDARKEFQAALDSQPDNANALTGMARVAAMNNDLAGARGFAEQAIAKDAHNIEALNFRGALLRDMQQPDEARAAFQEVLKLDPSNRAANLESAYLDIAAGKYDSAQAAISAAKANSPKNASVLYTQALLDYTRGKYEAARDNLQAVAKVAPDHPPSLLLAGATAFQLNNLKQAEANLRSYLNAVPNNPYARKLLATTLLRTGAPADAAAVLAPALKGKVSDVTLLELAGQVHMMNRDPAQAVSVLEQAVALEPKRASAHVALGGARLALGERDKGLAELEQAVTLDPDSLQAGMALARTRLALRQPDKALPVLAKLEAKHGKEAELFILKGRVLEAANDAAGARAAYDKAVQLAPTSYGASASLAQLELRERKPEAARQHLQRLLERDKGNVEAMTALAQLALQGGQRADGAAWLEKAAAVNPDALAPSLRLAGYYQQVNEHAKALVLLRKLQVANPEAPSVQEMLGRSQVASGDLAGAIDTFSKLAALLPKAPQPQLYLAAVHRQQKDAAAAQADLKKALSLDPNFVPARLMQADLAQADGKSDEALSILRALQKAQPKQPAGFLAEAELQMRLGKPALAVPPLEQAYAVAPAAPQVIKLAYALRAAKRDKDADAKVAAYRQSHPDDPVINLYLAEQALQRRDYPAAISVLEGVLAKLPDNAMALNNLAWAYQQNKDKRALVTAERAYQLAGENPTVMDTLGWVLLEQGQLERALPLLKKASELAPQAGEYRYHYASVLQKKGDKAGARKQLEAALAGPAFSQVEEARALMKTLQ